VLEALQCRLTTIAGARDDILFSREIGWAEGFPLPPGLDGLDWDEVCEDDVAMAQVTPSWIAERLAGEGYPDAATVQVSAAEDAVCVVKAFAPGLAANLRSRRTFD
jgi:ribosomal protein S12 methylthiotransferase accessory factor YcaO